MTILKLADVTDLPAYREHMLRHQSESGRDGDVIFIPYEEPDFPPLQYLTEEKTKKWSLPSTEVGWERGWVLRDDDRVYGHITLVQGIKLKSSLHRATLMIGIERSHRAQGWGQEMIETALSWVRSQPTLEWVDLFVFSENLGAIALYEKLGFLEIARVPDRFRVFGQSITDIHMTLKLRG